jgi:hypothetical protein
VNGEHDVAVTLTAAGTGPGPARTTPAAAVPPTGRLQRLASAVSPTHLAVVAAAGWALWQGVSPVNDLDAYWHVPIGQEILARHTLSGLGTDWLAEVPPTHWLTSQWLSEIGMARLVETFGWRGLVGVRLLLLAGILAVLAAGVLPRRPVLLAGPVLLVSALALEPLAQDRPQTVSLLFLAGLGLVTSRLLAGRRVPHPAVIAGACLLWAQIHPLWILAPAAFVLVGAAAAADGPRANAVVVRRAGIFLLASLAGVANPYGATAFLLPLRFRDATGAIAEWRPTTLTDPMAIALYAIVLLALVAWARSPRRAPRATMIWLLAWAGFGALALRDIGPSLLLCAPVAVDVADQAWRARLRAVTRPNRRGEGLALATVLTLVAVTAVAGATVRLTRIDPLRDAPARHLAERLAAFPAPVRVFNSYNASGSLVAFGGGKVRLAIDGRADLWGAAYIKRITDAQSLGPDWQKTFTQFRPDAAVLTKNAPLAVLLEHDRTWRVAATDGDYVLLLPATPQAATAP